MFVFHWCVSVLCTKKIKDTQCGEADKRDKAISAYCWQDIPVECRSSTFRALGVHFAFLFTFGRLLLSQPLVVLKRKLPDPCRRGVVWLYGLPSDSMI